MASTIIGFTSQSARNNAVSSGRISASAASRLPVGAAQIRRADERSGNSSSSRSSSNDARQQAEWDAFTSARSGFSSQDQNFRNVIPADPANTQRINIPTATAQFNPATTASVFGQSAVNADGSPKTPIEQSQSREADIFSTQMNQLFDLQNNKPSSADIFNQAQRESGIVQARQNVSDLSGQLNAIQAQAQASQLQVTGQGRGIPEAIIGGQQAQIAKEAAIQALPVAAQLQAAQGNLEMAQQNMEMLFKIRSDDAKQEFEFKSSIINAVANFSIGQEKAKLQEIQKQEERAYNETQQLFKRAEDFAGRALANNQSTLASKMMSLDHKSPTFSQDLAKLTAQLNDPIKAAQLRNLNQELSSVDAGQLVKINGADYIRYKDGSISLPVLPEAGNRAEVKARIETKIDTVDRLISGKQGILFSAGALRGKILPPGYVNTVNDWRADVKQILSTITLDELGRVKSDGVTFGALSDAERLAVGQAASSLMGGAITKNGELTGRFKMSENKVRDSLGIILNGYKLDFEGRIGVSYDAYKKNPSIISPENLYIESILGGGSLVDPYQYYNN